MNDRGGRQQYPRGALNGPPRRRKFRKFYPSRGGAPSGVPYRDHRSFSEDRDDSSPPLPAGPPNQNFVNHRQGPNDNDPLYKPRMHQRGSPQRGPPNRGNHHDHHDDSDYPQDINYQRQHNQYDKLAPNYDYPLYNQTHQQHQPQHSSSSPSTKKLEELTKSFHGHKTDIDEIKILFSKLSTELDQVKTRVRELESVAPKTAQQLQSVASNVAKDAGDIDEIKDARKKQKMKKRERRLPANTIEKQQTATQDPSTQATEQNKTISTDQAPLASGVSAPRKNERRALREKRSYKRGAAKISSSQAPPLINDDSTTQAAEPSSEDRPGAEDDREVNGKGRKVFRKKKPQKRNGPRQNLRQTVDSSETSPHNEANGTDDHQDKRKRHRKKVFPELNEVRMNEILQTLRRDFENSDKLLETVKGVINNRGPRVAYEFAFDILEHAICDVTSPAALTKTATKLQKLVCSQDNTSEVDFQHAFYEALKTISGREDEIAIDAPRYMDALGQLLADCITEMVQKHRFLVKKFLNRCVQAYNEKNRALLLASIMRGLQNVKSDRFAKEIWDLARLNWEDYQVENNDLQKFLESQSVEFTTKTFVPEPRKSKKAPEDLEKFADHVTNLVEAECSPQTLDELMKDFNEDELVEYKGTLIYAIIRGCLEQDAENYTIDNEALNKYSSILDHENEKQEDIALHALTALTRLWHHYGCPQDLMRLMLLTLYNRKTASFEALNTWLNSESLSHVPGMGAARLNTKRYIEDIGASLKT